MNNTFVSSPNIKGNFINWYLMHIVVTAEGSFHFLPKESSCLQIVEIQ
jgi:hypothetical protein